MEYVMWSILLLSGFFMLLVGADFFVDGAGRIAHRLGVSDLVIGLTVMALGSSAPEAFVSIGAALAGETDIAVGNVLGTNILNICLILGLCGVINRMSVPALTVHFEIPFLILITGFLAWLGYSKGYLERRDGVILCLLMVAYFIYLLKTARTGKKELQSAQTFENDAAGNRKKPALWLLVGLFLLLAGTRLTIEAVCALATAFVIGERTVALTVVAFGTSFPTLITCVSAARRHKTDMVVGNIVGTNIFNILFVLGISSLIDYIPYSGSYYVDGLAAFVISVMLWLCVLRRKELGRLSGVILLLCMIVYYVFLLWRHQVAG
ncbi:MAG: calcium/sodium antiporter [Lachnospiraceae bacterium]|nr:calcium/sodium antiporter [Lachnospiraceae bacterium]